MNCMLALASSILSPGLLNCNRNREIQNDRNEGDQSRPVSSEVETSNSIETSFQFICKLLDATSFLMCRA